MRLLNVENLEIVEFSAHKIPKYAILSHTWEDEEVSFEDMQAGRANGKAGLSKIRRCGEKASKDGYKYFWVDTCCIDKRSSAELSEAINSMHRWYQNAGICYAYLADVDNLDDLGTSFKKSRWFTRGWTLQELLAPEKIEFCASDWSYLGTRLTLQDIISSATGIDRNVIRGKTMIRDVSIAQRMSWASKRQTTRDEDIAYCLMGIFDVNMPLLYGEGGHAFLRLEEEIMKDSDDQSLFAWTFDDRLLSQEKTAVYGLLASSPTQFAESGNYNRCHTTKTTAPYSITNKGLRIEMLLAVPLDYFDLDRVFMAVLEYQVGTSHLSRIGIYLTQISEGDNQFGRVMPWKIDHIPAGMTPKVISRTIYVRQRYQIKLPEPKWGVFVPKLTDECRCKPIETYGNWDPQRRMIWSHSKSYGKLGAVKYCLRIKHKPANEFVVVIGMDPSSRVWCHCEQYYGRLSLMEYFIEFAESQEHSSTSTCELPGFKSSKRPHCACAEVKVFEGPGEEGIGLFVLDVFAKDLNIKERTLG